jgi:hypothetical protein
MLNPPPPQWAARIFGASTSWHAKMVELIDLNSSDEDTNDGYEDIYDVESDDEDSDNVLPPPPSSPECHKCKAPDVVDCSNKKV